MVGGGGLGRIIGNGFCQFELQHQIGATMLDGLKRTDGAAELHPHLDVIDSRIEQRLGSPNHFIGEGDGGLIERACDSLGRPGQQCRVAAHGRRENQFVRVCASGPSFLEDAARLLALGR